MKLPRDQTHTTSTKSGFIISMTIGLVFLIWAIDIISNETGLDIKKSSVISGKVIHQDIIRTRGRHSRRFFYFRLNNSNQQFTTDRSYEGYDDLVSAMHIGDSIKVYYQPNLSGYNRRVFQIEKNGLVLESYRNYDKRVSDKAAIILFAGIAFIAMAVLNYRNIKIWVLLNKLVGTGEVK